MFGPRSRSIKINAVDMKNYQITENSKKRKSDKKLDETINNENIWISKI